MNGRSSWSAKSGRRASDERQGRSEQDFDLPLEDLLDARFDAEGRLANVGRGARQRIADKMDARPPTMGVDDLERAVQRLARGLEAMERRRGGTRSTAEPAQRAPASLPDISKDHAPRSARNLSDPVEKIGDHEIVTYGLDRLEARLDAIGRELERRASAQAPAPQPKASPESEPEPRMAPPVPEKRPEPPKASERAADAEMRRQLGALEARVEMLQQRGDVEELERVRAELRGLGRRMEEFGRSGRAMSSIIEEAQARIAAVENAIAEARESAEGFEDVRSKLLAIEAELEGARGVADAVLDVRTKVSDIETSFGEVETMRTRMAAIESKINATRNLAGNRLGELHDRIADLSERLAEYEENPVVAEVLRENHAEIVRRIDRFEAVAQQFVAPEDLEARIAEIGAALGTLPSQRAMDHIEEQILSLAERLDTLPEGLAEQATLDRIEGQLQALAAELGESRRLTTGGTADLTSRLSEIAAGIEGLRTDPANVDFDPLQRRLGEIVARIEQGRRAESEAAERLEARLAQITAALEKEEDDSSVRLLAALEGKLDNLGAAIAGFDPAKARDGIADLGRKLEEIGRAIGAQSERLGEPLLKPLEQRLDALYDQLREVYQSGREERQRQASALTSSLADIGQRLSGIAAQNSGPLAKQLATIESRLADLQSNDSDAILREHFAVVLRKLDEVDAKSLDTDRLQAIEAFLRELRDEGRQDQRSSAQLETMLGKLDAISAEVRDPTRFAAIEERLVELLPDEHQGEIVQKQLDGIFRKLEHLDASSSDPTRLAGIEEQLRRMQSSDGLGADLQAQLDRILLKLAQIDDHTLDADHFAAGIERIEAQLTNSGQDTRLARIEEKLDAAAPARLAELLDSLRKAARPVSEDRLARVEEKLDSLGVSISAGSDLIDPQELAEMRADITALRRELRSLPGLGDGETNLAKVLTSVADKLDRLPDEAPATARDLQDHVERIASLLEDPAHSRLAFAHIETSLKSIETALFELAGRGTRLTESDVEPPRQAPESDFVEPLSGGLEALRQAARDSDLKAQNTIESVQDTLEAVVKRMAFLERDADRDQIRTADLREETRTHRAGLAEAENDVLQPIETTPEPEAIGDDEPGTALLAAGVAEGPEDRSPSPAEPETWGSDRPASSLISRLTSRQLLRRATGGRAETFSSYSDDPESVSDLPLEPGTDKPLESALAGAPSSDTSDFSWSRSTAPELSAEASILPASADPSGWRRGAVAGDDFLAAARRAAQAAAAEVAEAEEAQQQTRGARLGKLTSLLPHRRRTLLAGAAAIAVALVGYQALRSTETPPSASSPAVAAAPADVEAAEPELPPQPDIASITEPENPPAAALAANAAGENASATTGNLEPGPSSQSNPGDPAAADTQVAPAQVEPLPAPTLAAINPAELPDSIGSAELRSAALGGDAAAAFEVAARYADGRGVEQDMAAAVRWYTRAAEQGLAPAQYRLGSIYENGLGVRKDLAQAQDWYRRAADAGNVKAIHNLAVLYAEGAGGEPDLSAAAGLFRKAAEFGVRDSQFNIGILHARGIGVPQDMVEAYKWFAIAAQTGDPESEKRRDAVSGTLNAAERKKADDAASAFRPAPLDQDANVVPEPEGGWGDPVQTTSSLAPTADVQEVQALLSRQGFDPGAADGVIGTKTKEAIAGFQARAGLPVTGEIDAGTVEALTRASS